MNPILYTITTSGKTLTGIGCLKEGRVEDQFDIRITPITIQEVEHGE